MKSIRWGGLIAFIITVLVFASALLFAGGIIKPLMESSLTDMNGAKVDIEEIDISYAPLTIDINNVQITDPEQAMVNTAQIDKVKFVLSLGDTLLGKVIIDEASINGIQVDTPRSKSGLIKKADEEDVANDASDDGDTVAMPELDFPDIKEILAAESLLSDKLINELQWQKISDTLPNKLKSDDYETRFNKIQNDIKGNTSQKIAAVKDAKQLSKDLKQEAQRVKQAKQQFSTDLDRISAEIKAVKDAPAMDVARIKNKYNLDNLNAENVSQMLFGNQVAGYVTLAKKWYARIEPYLPEEDETAEPPKVERSKGVDIIFKESDPRPDLYVRVAAITANLPRGQFEGIITAISSDQTINKEPLRLKLKGVSLTNKESEEISGEFNYVDKDNGFSRFKYAVVKSRIDDFVISGSSKLPLTMKQAMMDFNLDAKLQHGSLKGIAKTQFNQVGFDSGDSSSLLASSFKSLNAFDLNAQFSGSISDLSIKIDSDLDNQLGKELKKKLNQKKLAFEADLKTRVDEKLKEPMDKIAARKAKLDSIKNKIDDSEKQMLQRLASLKATIDNEKNLKKKEKTDALKNKLKGKFGF